MKLNEVGKSIKKGIIDYLKEIDEYRKVEEIILIDSTAKSYELYIKYQDLAEAEMNNDDDDEKLLALKYHALSSKQYVMYTTNLKTLGVSAIQRAKIKIVQEEDEDEDNILSVIKNGLKED